MMQTILILGASGFVGRQLARALLADGHAIRCLARDPNRLEDLAAAGCEIVKGDISDLASVQRAMQSIDAVYISIHTLSPQRATSTRPRFMDAEKRGLQNVITACRLHGADRVVYVTSLGTAPDAPSEWLRERWGTERLLLDSGLHATVIRPGMIVGRGGRGFDTVISQAKRRIAITLGGKRPKMRTIALPDLIYYLGDILDDRRTYGQRYDVGGDDVLTMDEMIDITAGLLGRRPPVKVPLPPMLLRALGPLIERASKLPGGAIVGFVDSLKSDAIGDPEPIAAILPRPRISFCEAAKPALGLPLAHDATNGAPANSAAWLLAKHSRLAVGPAPYTPPRDNEIVIKNFAVAINPVDWIKQIAGNFVFPWIAYPFVLGSDCAGEIVEVGAAVSRLRVGDRVLGHAVGTDPKRNRAAEGAFQYYTVVLADMAAPIPGDMSFERAAVLPLGLSTAACGLFQKDFLALDYPSVPPKPNGKVLLVWGGSTSVGSNAIQLAVAAGYDVVTTASPKNFAYVKQLGAGAAFDYNARTVVADVLNALQGKSIAGALAIGAGSAEACVEVVGACKGNRFVSMATFPISFAQTLEQPAKGLPVIAMARRFAWFSLTMWFKTRSRQVRTKFIFGSSLIANEVSRIVYVDFLPKALREGRFVAAPSPSVVGNGLAAIQGGLDVLKNGVSATKVVVTLYEA